MGDYDLKSMQDAISKSLVELTRTSGQLAAEDLEYFRVSRTKEGKQLDRTSAKILQLSRKLLQTAAAGTSISVPPFSSAEALDDSWPSVVEVIDDLLEKTDVALDEFSGVIKKLGPEAETLTKTDVGRAPYTRRSGIPKPQLLFEKKPPNHAVGAFKPLLRTKPHATVPLSESLTPQATPDSPEQYDTAFYLCIRDNSPIKGVIDAAFRYKHPYQVEIEQYEYPPRVRQWTEPRPYTSFNDTKAVFVDTLKAVHEMLAELKEASEIAVDLEHHDKHSYIGLVSLMQISTRNRDWIIDTLKPWREELQVLNEVFTDPSILKVFHGSSSDIIWLQRDLGIYVVGLFDTYWASTCLRYAGRGLAFLLDKFANVKAQKQYQMADWRVRPLSPELIDYARSDTHYLLWIYDNMRNELVEQSKDLPPEGNLVDEVLRQSKKECLQKYDYFVYDEVRGTGRDGWYQMLIRTPALFTKQQFSVFRAVHQWRDEVARAEDENIAYVMQKQVLFSIARQMPRTPKDLYSCAQPMSELLRERVDELIAIVREAVAAGESGPDMKLFLDEHPETIRWKAEKAERARARGEQKYNSLAVGDVVRRELHNDDSVPLAAIQAPASSFWGTTIQPSRFAKEAITASPRLQVPLPPHTAGVDDAIPAIPVDETEHKLRTLSTSDSPATKPDVTILRDRTKKRKARAPSPSTNGYARAPADPMLADVVALDSAGAVDEDADADAARAAKRARKDARRAERAQADAEPPFDYAAAPSVLNARPAKGPTGATPWAKSRDAAKGARRERREEAGTSRTFAG